MPGSGGGFAVEVRWLGADEGRLDDGLLERLTSSVHSGRTVQSFADALFEKHGDKLNLSGDAQSLSEKIVAYRATFDSDDEGGSVPVELDDVVAESSLLTFRPRVPEADAQLLVAVAYVREEEQRFAFFPLRLSEVAGLGAASCYNFARFLARKRDTTRSLSYLDPQDLEFSVASEYSDQGTESVMPALDREDRFVSVNASASVSEVVDPRRGRRKCHVLLVERARVHLLIEIAQPGVITEPFSAKIPPEEAVALECADQFMFVVIAKLSSRFPHHVLMDRYHELRDMLRDMESDGILTAYCALETRDGRRSPRSPRPLSATPIRDASADDLRGAKVLLSIEFASGVAWSDRLAEKVEQLRATDGKITVQFSDSDGPHRKVTTFHLDPKLLKTSFDSLAKHALETSGLVVRSDAKLPKRALLWKASEGTSVPQFLQGAAFSSVDRHDPSVKEVRMSESMLDVLPTRDLEPGGPGCEYCFGVIFRGRAFSLTYVRVSLIDLGSQFSDLSPPDAVVVRDAELLDGSPIKLLKEWLHEMKDKALRRNEPPHPTLNILRLFSDGELGKLVLKEEFLRFHACCCVVMLGAVALIMRPPFLFGAGGNQGGEGNDEAGEWCAELAIAAGVS